MLARGGSGCLVLSSDLPLIDAGSLRRLLERAEAVEGPVAVVAPALGREGTNALYLRPIGGFDLQFGEASLPRFAAEPSQEDLPYGRWADRLSTEFLAACLGLDTDGVQLGEPDDIRWYPDRTWHGRTYVPGTSITANGYELFGYVRFIPADEDGEQSDFSAHVDFTEETAERNPDWKLDLCDEVIGAWRRGSGVSGAWRCDCVTGAWRRDLIH